MVAAIVVEVPDDETARRMSSNLSQAIAAHNPAAIMVKTEEVTTTKIATAEVVFNEVDR